METIYDDGLVKITRDSPDLGVGGTINIKILASGVALQVTLGDDKESFDKKALLISAFGCRFDPTIVGNDGRFSHGVGGFRVSAN